jgi:hypothetical protein
MNQTGARDQATVQQGNALFAMRRCPVRTQGGIRKEREIERNKSDVQSAHAQAIFLLITLTSLEYGEYEEQY